MHLSLKSLAIAGAVALPVALSGAGSLVVGASVAHAVSDSAVSVKAQLARYQPSHLNKLTLRRCLIPSRWLYVREFRRLRSWGYRHVRYAGYYQYRPRCTQVIRFKVCRGWSRYNVSIVYRYSRRIRTHFAYAGRCFFIHPHLRKHKRSS